MSHYPDHLEYRRAWAQAYGVDPPVPLNVDIEVASICNLRCPYCFIPDPNFKEFISQKSEDGKPLRRLMPVDLAFKIIDQAAEIGVPALKFNWRGESTLHPEYSTIVKYAAQKFTFDNELVGNLRSYPDRDESCMDGNRSFLELLANTNANCHDFAIGGLMACTKVMISLDSMDSLIYPQMRVGGKLDWAKETIWKLVNGGHKNVWVRRVLTKLNEKEDFFDAVTKEWGEKVKVSEHFCFDRNATVQTEVAGCDHDDGIPRRYCGYPSQRLIVTSAGFVYPCCLDLHETMRVGDLNTQTLKEVWEGQPLKALRANLRNNDLGLMSKTCQNCESWMAYDAPQRDHVQDREGVRIAEERLKSHPKEGE